MTDGVLKLGYTSVIFVDLGVKVSGTYYSDLLLSQLLLPAICHASSEFVCKAPFIATQLNSTQLDVELS